ncbi:MAG TPA: hypothetical protein VGE20_01485 [Ramlibacter sp.]
MKPIFQRVLFGNRRKGRAPGASSSVSSTLTTRDIETYYLRVIGNCLKRMLIKEEDVQIGVRRTGTAASGLSSFAGYVRVLRWDPVVTPVVLQNLPVIDARIRKVVSASVLLEHTQFDGLWVQASSGTQGSPTSLLGLPAELKYQSRPVSL